MAKKHKLNPLLADPHIFIPSVIENTPYFFPVEVGGLVPWSSWMINIFCKNILKLQAYYDDEVIKMLAPSEIFPLDASYKVPNWIMWWGGSKMFDVLESGLNEYGKIIMKFFA